MLKTLKKVFWLDDRTGIPSTSKLIRWLTFFLSSFFIMASMSFILLKWLILDDKDIEVLTIVKEFLIFLIPTVEGFYQLNRSQKMKNGHADTVKPEDDQIQTETIHI